MGNEQILINNCNFDSCVGENKRCFDITISTTDFTFSNNVIQNLVESGNKGYFGGINCNNKLLHIVLENITFINNRCNTDYGGGSGLWITNTDTISFDKCKFINNYALKSPDSRSQRPDDKDYYSGDGGGIQYGFSSSISDVSIIFNECIFERNKAFRHGGAIALQTIQNVEIVKCTFTDNVADYQTSASKLLNNNNYYHMKEEGRGGAIYLNPTFSYKDANSESSTFGNIINGQMKSVKIEGCTFTSNKAFDGYAIYIEGDNLGTTFIINDNTFTDNYNEESYSALRSIITSEIPDLYEGKVIKSNTFKYTDSNINVEPLLYVDHYGNPTTESPTQSPTESPSQSPVSTPSQSPTESPTQSATESPLPTQYLYDGGVHENIANGTDNKNNFMQFDCPIIDGSIKIYTVCKNCNKIDPTQKVWFEVFFKNGNLDKVEHQDILIHNTANMSQFVLSSKINYNPTHGVLSYVIDSKNMYYVESEPNNLKCRVPPMTPLPTQYLYDGGTFENIANGTDNKNNFMQFDCPIIDGSIKIYTQCSACNKIDPTQKVWFEVFFKNGNLDKVEHQDILIHNTANMSQFVLSSKINYDPTHGVLSYVIDSKNMYYAESEPNNLKCRVPPMTPRATISQSPVATPSQSLTESPSQSPVETPSQSPTEPPPTDVIIISPEEVGNDKRVDRPNPDTSEAPKLFPTVQINVTNFTDIKYEGDFGGAIHIINYGFVIRDTKFQNCTSEKASGGIYIKNTNKNINKNIILEGLTLNECGAVYGGAVYIYSDSTKSSIRIKTCIFTKNKASNDDSLPLYGGSSIFITARKARVIGCTMADNEGIDVKLYNQIDDNSRSKELSLDNNNNNNNEESIIFSNCKFATNMNEAKSSSLIYYVGGKNGVPIEMKECSFIGKLRVGSNYIDGKIINEKSHKLIVKKCQFDDNRFNSIKLINRKTFNNALEIDNQKDYISIDFNDQKFNYDKNDDANQNKSFEILFLTAIFAVGIIVYGLIVFVLNKTFINNTHANEIELVENDL